MTKQSTLTRLTALLFALLLLTSCCGKSPCNAEGCTEKEPVVFVEPTNTKPYGIVASETYVYWVDVKREGGRSSAVLNQAPIVQPENSVELASVLLGDIPESPNAIVTGLAVDERDGVAIFGAHYSSGNFRVYVLKQNGGDWSVFNEVNLGSTGLPTGVAYHNNMAYFIQYDGQRKLYKLDVTDPSAAAHGDVLDFFTNHANKKQSGDSLTPPRLGGLEVVGDYLYFTDPYPYLPPDHVDEWLFRVPLSGGAVEAVAMSDAQMGQGRFAVLIDYYDGVFYTGSKRDNLYYWTDNGNVKLTPNLVIKKTQLFGVAANSKHLFFTSFNDQKIYKMCKPRIRKPIQLAPNLVAQNVSIDFAAKTVNVTVKNIGNQRANEHLTYIEINSTDATDRDKPQSQLILQVPALEAGESKVYENISFNTFGTSGGLNFSSLECGNLVVHVDAKNVVTESIEVDNLYDQSTTCTGTLIPPGNITVDFHGGDLTIIDGHGGSLPLPKICQYVKSCPGCNLGLCPGFTMHFEKVSHFDIKIVDSFGNIVSKAYGKAGAKTLQIKSRKVSPSKKQTSIGGGLFIQFSPRKGIKPGSHQVKVEVTQKQFKKKLK